MSTNRRTLGVHSRSRPLGPNGERLCYNCGGPLPKGRRFNCCHQCSEEWVAKTTPSYMRRLLLDRDKGICAICGTDCEALRKEYDAIDKRKLGATYSQARTDFLRAHGIPQGRTSSDFWDADHIVPVVEGGGESGPENFRTLCIPCHQKETAELARRRARARHQARPLPLFDAAGV